MQESRSEKEEMNLEEQQRKDTEHQNIISDQLIQHENVIVTLNMKHTMHLQVEAHTGEVIYVLNDDNQEISYESDVSIHVGDSFTCDDAYFNFIDPCYGMSSSVVKIRIHLIP